MTKPSKREIAAATRAINEQIDLIADIAAQDGQREARANAVYSDTVRRMSRAINTLIQAGEPMPGRLAANWAHYGACGWHNRLQIPA